MLSKIKRQDCLVKYPSLPTKVYDEVKDAYDIFFPDVFGNYVLTLPAKSFNGHSKLLGIELIDMAKAFNYSHLIFLGDKECSWLLWESGYKQAKEAQIYFKENKAAKKFEGALEVENREIIVFIKHLCWLTRTNMLIPDIFFTDPEQNFVGHICLYGNLHIVTLHQKADMQLKDFLSKSMFEFVKEGKCQLRYTK